MMNMIEGSETKTSRQATILMGENLSYARYPYSYSISVCLSVCTKGSRQPLDQFGFPLQCSFSQVLGRFVTIFQPKVHLAL